MYIKTLDARCSPLQQRDFHSLLETFSSFVTDMLSAHIPCVPQGYLSSSMESKPLLPCSEDVEKDRTAGKHHCKAVIPVAPNPACFTQVNRFVHCGSPVAGLSAQSFAR